MLFGKKQKKENKKEPPAAKALEDKDKKKETPERKISAVAEGEYGYRLIRSPHISEKAGNVSSSGQYIFKVFKRANKTEIKKAVEKMYGVNVEGVNVVYIPSKKRTVGKYEGKKRGHKKAIVTLRKGQTIEVAPR